MYADRIKEHIHHDLQAKGWQLVPTGAQATETATTTTVNHPVADLVIGTLNANNKELIGRGIIKRGVQTSTENNVRGLSKDLRELFQNFLPRTNG